MTRRSFGIGIATVSTLSLAGCLNDDDGDGDVDSDEDDGSNGDNGSNGDGDNESNFDYINREEHTLVIHFENENGERVTPPMEGRLAPDGFTAASINFGPTSVDHDILEVECQEGTWRLTVESTEDEFESVEEEIVLDSDTEITVTLDGAVPFSERNTEDGGE